MEPSDETAARKIFIASASPLFAKGLEKILRQQNLHREVEIRHAVNLIATLEVLEEWQPDLVIVDYDDRRIERGEFLNHFVQSERPMQLMLVSLKENGAVVVYDRRVLTSDQAEDWLGFSQFKEP
jgi:cytochrome c oxidase subunit II